jgi:translocator protein
MDRKWIELGAFLLLVLGGGIFIGSFTMPGEWYASLNKPSFNPPNWLFGPAWTILYILIAIAGWRIWRRAPQSAAMKIWWISLVFNFLWSPVFFGAQKIGLGLVVVLAMLASIVAFIEAARRLDGTSALLFLPYAVWVSFASLLNASIYTLN